MPHSLPVSPCGCKLPRSHAVTAVWLSRAAQWMQIYLLRVSLWETSIKTRHHACKVWEGIIDPKERTTWFKTRHFSSNTFVLGKGAKLVRQNIHAFKKKEGRTEGRKENTNACQRWSDWITNSLKLQGQCTFQNLVDVSWTASGSLS